MTNDRRENEAVEICGVNPLLDEDIEHPQNVSIR